MIKRVGAPGPFTGVAATEIGMSNACPESQRKSVWIGNSRGDHETNSNSMVFSDIVQYDTEVTLSRGAPAYFSHCIPFFDCRRQVRMLLRTHDDASPIARLKL